MLREFKLPDVGEGLTEAEIVRWHVAPGDPVRVNQTIVEIETAKAVVELPCPFEGVVGSLLAAEGETVDVGKPIITVETEPGAPSSSNGTGGAASERGPELGAGPAVEQAAGRAPDRAAAVRAVPEPPAEGAVEPGVEGGPAPKQERQPVLVGYGVKLGSAKRRPRKAGPGRGPAGTSPGAPSFPGAPAPGAPVPAGAPGSAAPPEALASPGTPPAPPAPGGHRVAVLAKPPVRKLAKDLGVDLTKITGTGPQGSITRQDVHQAAEARTEAVAAPAEPGREERIPVRGVQKAMASAMVASAFSVPHVTEFLQVDATATVDAVARLRAMPDFAEVKVSPLLLVARALLVAVKRHPLINSSWDGDAVVVKHYVNLGIAAATERGLIVPNIKDAHALSLPGLAAALSELTAKARAGRTQPADTTGGTITITNVGVFGVDAGTPIINPGEAAILAFGQIRDLPWVVDGAIVPRKVCTLALSFDHRIVDGELGSHVLRDVGAMLEDPLRLLAWS
ncbi:2-oxo acid dehydrogenase subunit E2 [Thermopolyspora sp. NPDC052614]|uniref:dihydrolipoamide acetyltransferase family protein n=1 Tax=Thermopolyspora sp. NPDC052614 TaxID=3155682 RepID=UPI00342451AE